MTRAAFEALPVSPIRYLVITSFGKPFSVAGLGNMMREWCDAAGLKHCPLHGAAQGDIAACGRGWGTDAEGQAVTGHKKSETFSYYRAKANRVALADRAMSNLASRFDVQPKKED